MTFRATSHPANYRLSSAWRPGPATGQVAGPGAAPPVGAAAAHEPPAQPLPDRFRPSLPGRVLIAPGVPIVSNAGQPAGAGFEGRVARESLAALQRAGGTSYVYLSPANGHREVVVWAPPGFDPCQPYALLTYNRGTHGDTAQSLEQQHLATSLGELNRAGRNVLVVMPKSPSNAQMRQWFAGQEDLGRLLDEALPAFRRASGLPLEEPRERWLMAHSGAGASVVNMLAKPVAPRFAKILLADSSYRTWAADALAALRRRPGSQLAAVTTPMNAAKAAAQLGQGGVRVDPMPATYRFPGHHGVPAYMVEAFLGPRATHRFTRVGSP